MSTTRTVTLLTANLGRGVSFAEFRHNVDKIIKETPGTHRFFQWQEIGEADFAGDRELNYIRKKLSETHRFAGLKTHVPIAIPRTFKVRSRNIVVASEGVKGLSPRRHVVQAVVYPEGHPKARVVANNTHFARETRALNEERRSADRVLQRRLGMDLPSWLTADLNSLSYPKLSKHEISLVEARRDYIRAYNRQSGTFNKLNTGSVNLTIDGHNAHWARVRITWP